MADDKKKPAKTPSLKEARATQKISKEELAALIKRAEEADAAGGSGNDDDDSAEERAVKKN